MTGLWAELRPYLVVWPAARRLAFGTWTLLRALWSRCIAGEGWEKLWRPLGCLVAASVVWRLMQRAPLVELPLLAAWTVAAWRAGPAPKTEQVADTDDGQEQEPDQTPEEPPLPTTEQLTAALHHVADPHAHLAALAAHLSEAPARVRDGLKEAGIPVAGGVRAGGRVSTGVKRDHFPPLLPPAGTAPDGVVVAGQPSNNNTAGVVLEKPHAGMTIIRYLEETARRRHTVPRR